LQLLTGWVLFGGTHVLGSSLPIRRRLIGRLGLGGFKSVYSVVALATFVPLFWIYWHDRHAGAMLFDPPGWARHATELLMLPAVLFVVLAVATPGPATTVVELRGVLASSARGVQRITRHPMNTGFGLFGVAHMASNPTVGDWIFWGGWVVYALASAAHQDRRMLAGGPAEFRAFYRKTSFVPFVALATGRQRLVWSEFRLPVVVGGLALYVLIRWAHPFLIGGFD
jgi:uncharacterized membrane protein